MNAEDIKKLVEQKAAFDPRLRSIVRRMESGTATFKETSEYSRIFSEIVGNTLSEHVLSLEDREAVANELLRYGYENINSILAKVQADIDKKNRVNIRPQKASFPQERAEQFSHSLTDPTVPDETIERRANNGTANITMSFHDDYMRENAEFRSNAGLRCYIDRQTNGKCCTWCSDIAGRYDYGNEPQDVYRRHDNCDCTVTYENGRQRQDVWSKRTWTADREKIKYTKPTIISRAEAQRLNDEKVSNNRQIVHNSSLDNSDGNGIMNDNRTGIILNTELYHGEVVHYDITEERINHISDVELSSLSAENNEKLTQGCRELLSYMSDVPLGCEGAMVFGMDMNELDRYRAENTTSSVSSRTYSTDCIVIHNHPSDTILSDADLFRFYEHDEYKILGAVGHNGSLYFVEKQLDYDMYGFYDYLEECKRPFSTNMSGEDIIKYVESVIKGAEEYGVKFYTKIYS